MVDVTWLGHACFLLKGEKSLVFDPFKGTGLPEPEAKADIVLCSHSHSDHNNTAAVQQERSLILEGFTGSKEINGVSIRGIATFHDDAQGSKRGRNSVYIVNLDGVVFCHLGDLGEPLSPSQIIEVGAVDVLFLPVGGFYTISPEQARKTMESIKPKITVPMHYRILGMSSAFNGLSTVDDFIHTGHNVKRLGSSTFSVSRENLKGKSEILVPKLL